MPTHRLPLESPESSSPTITRAVAAALQGTYSDTNSFRPWQRAGLEILGHFPSAIARFIVSHFRTFSGLDPRLLAGLSIDTLIKERLRDYADLNGTFPAITMGVGLGGASAHLAIALGGPFLPEAFVLMLRGGAAKGDVHQYYQRSTGLAHNITLNNPEVFTIQHYDPVHDGWMTRYVNHLRFKLLGLPASYKEFIQSKLNPGGTVCYLDCGAQWLRYRIGERSAFQVGGWGDISPEEFLDASPRILRYCQRSRFQQPDWRLTGFPLESGPESEWGSEPGLCEALKAFCHQNGYRFAHIQLPEPKHFSLLAFLAIERLLQKDGRQAAGVLIEMFNQYDATAVMRSGLLPLWLVFNTLDSLAFLKEMRPAFPEGKPAFFSALSTFAITPDLTPWQEWEAALQGLDWYNTGSRASHYPADGLALNHWQEPIHRWIRQDYHERPIRNVLNTTELLDLADRVRNSVMTL